MGGNAYYGGLSEGFVDAAGHSGLDGGLILCASQCQMAGGEVGGVGGLLGKGMSES